MPLRALLREPLVHFVVAGGLLFGLHRLVAPRPTIAGEVVIDREWARAVGGELGRALGRPPSAEELAGALGDAVDQELLYREGLALGLDRGDPIVRRRVIQRARFLHEDRAELAAIDDAELAQALAAAPERYRLPPRVALTQVFVAGDRLADPEAEARRLLAALAGGEDPRGLGDPFPHGQVIGRRSPAELASIFGPGMVDALAGAPLGAWLVARSSLGWHVVRIDEREEASVPALAEVRGRVERDVRERRRAEAVDAAVAGLRGDAAIRIELDDPELRAALEGRLR